jgi:ABC-type branched-subunit amino acid transport system substrate-binding protein
MQIAIEVENEPRIEVIFKDPGFQDPAADLASAEQIARNLVKTDQVNLLVGPLLSEQAPAVRTVALQERIPQLSLSKGNAFETGDIIFRFGATSNSQMDTLLDAASDVLGMQKFAIVYPELPFGLEYATSFKKYLTAKGLQLVYEASYAPGDSSKLSIIASEVERLSIDGIFVPDNIEGARSFLSLLSEEFRNRVRPMGPATWDSPQALAQSQAIFNRAIFISPFFMGSSNPLIRKFIDRYKAKFGKAPDFLAAQGFDAITLAIGAARKVINEGGSFDLALKHIESYDGLTGRMQVDVSGEVRRAYAVLELREGRLQILARDSKGDLSGQAQTNQENSQETTNQGRY